MNRHTAIWLVVGAGLGAAFRNLAATAGNGLTVLIVNAVMTVAAGLAAGVALGLLPNRWAALGLGVAAGVASAAIYAVLGLTSDLWLGVAYVAVVPLATAATFTVGAILVARRRPKRVEAGT